ncbi:O-antigen polysaccharide polymerase Wzy [Corynebacterium sp. 3HC-13]|uniref:O-antigen polysaccharide polymerase Wzy n=1 Tax=Corynebacterium poyangense TaxID=2684405 RepID=UPI001CCE61FC|nr:O-antigen polysaccharide polymerase Wzy [Corynebacterium poyangense]MBZ8177038.1 O-antigen polysaccharide polymerase Wzy [Corynebacterium poyangense]
MVGYLKLSNKVDLPLRIRLIAFIVAFSVLFLFLAFNSDALIFGFVLAIWISWLGYLISLGKSGVVSVIFYLFFGAVLLGRETIDLTFNLRINDFPQHVNKWVYVELASCLIAMIFSYSILQYAGKEKRKGGNCYHIVHDFLRFRNRDFARFELNLGRLKYLYQLDIRSSLVYLFIFLLMVSYLKKSYEISYVLQNGYLSLYTEFAKSSADQPWLILLTKCEQMLQLSFSSILAFSKVNKKSLLLIGGYVIYLVLTLLTGQRFNATVGLLILVIFFILKCNHVIIKFFQQRTFTACSLLVLGIISAILILEFVEHSRGTGRDTFTSPVLNLLYQQGVSIMVLKRELLYHDHLNQDIYYSLSFLYYGIFARFRGIPVLHGNTVENALNGASLSRALTYALDKPLYLRGGGYGSSFIAEAHADFGLIGVIIIAFLYGALLYWLDGIGCSARQDILRYLLIPLIIWAPRGEATGFVTTLFQPANLLFIALLLAFALVSKVSQWFTSFIGATMKKLLLSVAVNFISLVTVGLLTLVLPGILGHTEYSWWQVYVMWSIYGGYLTLGLTDGAYLMYGGFSQENVPSKLISVQLKSLIGFHLIFSIFAIAIMIWWKPLDTWYWLVICVVFSNLFYVPRLLLTAMMQTTSSIVDFSKIIILEKLVYLFGAAEILTTGYRGFIGIIFMDLFSKAVGFSYSLYLSKEFLSWSDVSFSELKSEIFKSMSIGLYVVVANFCSLLINGIVRMVIHYHWGLAAFGYISFSFTIANLVITFGQAISIVIFPYLKRFDIERYSLIYNKISAPLTLFLTLSLLCYFPLSLFIGLYLPEYKFPVIVLGILFPMMLFEARYRVLDMTYLKALRMERFLMVNNILSVLIALALSTSIAYYFNNIVYTVLVITIVTAWRCLSSEIALRSRIDIYPYRDLFISVIGSSLMCIVVLKFHFISGGLLMLLYVIVVLLIRPRIDVSRPLLIFSKGA